MSESDIELVVYVDGVRKVIGTAQVSDQDSNKVAVMEITDPEWQKIINQPTEHFSIAPKKRHRYAR